MARMKMPEPTGEMAKVPEGWPPQTWGAHLANLAWMEAMGRAHFSMTDPKWNVEEFRKAVIADLLRGIAAYVEKEAAPARATNFPSSWSVEAGDDGISVTLRRRPLAPVDALCFAAQIVSVAERMAPGVDFGDILAKTRKL